MQTPASSAHLLRLLCWEGYEAESVTRRFESAFGFAVRGETLLSDSVVFHTVLQITGDIWSESLTGERIGAVT